MSQAAPVLVDRVSLRCPNDWTDTVDVLFDGHRVWSFRGRRHPREEDHRVVAWPGTLVPYLHGETTLTLRDHVSGADLAVLEVRFDDEPGRVSVRDASGNPLALDKWDNVIRTFASKADTYGLRLLEDLERLFAVLGELEVQAHLAYGSLLGAQRSGAFIAHDSDADISYVSAYDDPALVVLESLRIERGLRRRGWGTKRMTGGFLQVWAPGRTNAEHIDIFTGYFVGDHYHLDRWVRGPARRSDLLPLGEVSLEGHRFPAPANPERVLELTYGPQWRVPDPSFKFSHPRSTMDRARGWLGQQRWTSARRSSAEASAPPGEAAGQSDFACWAAARVTGSDAVLELGSGWGVDAVFLAGVAARVHGLDPSHGRIVHARSRAEAAGVGVTFERLTFLDLRLMVVAGAELAREGRSGRGRVVVANGLVEHLSGEAVWNVWALARCALEGGGRFLLSASDGRADQLVGEARARGGKLLHRESRQGEQWCELSW